MRLPSWHMGTGGGAALFTWQQTSLGCTNSDGEDSQGDAGEEPKQDPKPRRKRVKRMACFLWNDGKCSSSRCRFEHVCSWCFGEYRRSACHGRQQGNEPSERESSPKLSLSVLTGSTGQYLVHCPLHVWMRVFTSSHFEHRVMLRYLCYNLCYSRLFYSREFSPFMSCVACFLYCLGIATLTWHICVNLRAGGPTQIIKHAKNQEF